MHPQLVGVIPSANRTWERPLGPLEQWFYIMDGNRANHFSMTVQIVGVVSPRECALALAQLQLRHPLLNVLIESNSGAAPSFRTVAKAIVPLRLAHREGSESWKEELEKEAASAIDTRRAPLIRAVLLAGANQSELIFSIHHSLSDGTGLLFLFRDFFDVLSGRTLEPLSLPPSIESIRKELGLPSPVGVNVGREAPAGTQPLTYRSPTTAVKTSVMNLTGEQTSQISDAARQQEVTVHAALTAALVIAGRELSSNWREDPVRVFSPINLRKELGLQEEVTLVLGAGVVRFDNGELSPFWELARQAMTDLALFRTTDSNFFLGEVLGKVAASADTTAMIVAEHFGYELMLSNLGRLDLNVGNQHLTVTDIWGPAVTFGFEHEQCVAALSYKGALHLTHTSPAPISGLLAKAVKLMLTSSQ